MCDHPKHSYTDSSLELDLNQINLASDAYKMLSSPMNQCGVNDEEIQLKKFWWATDGK